MAIAFDNVATGGGNSPGATINWTHTITGSNTLFLAWVTIWKNDTSTPSATTMTANSGALSATLGFQNGGTHSNSLNFYRSSIWWIVGPSAGDLNLTLSLNNATASGALVKGVSYTGVDQTNWFDTVGGTPNENWSFSASDTGLVNPISDDEVVTNTGCWMVTSANGPKSVSLTPSGTQRGTISTAAEQGFGIADSNGIVGTGSQSQTWTGTSAGSTFWPFYSGAIINPAADAPPPSTPGGMGALIVARKMQEAWKRRRKSGLWVPGDHEPVMA